VPFPFTDQSTSKQRPAVIISSAAYQRERADRIILAITSQVRSGNSVGEAQVFDWKQAGLLKPLVMKSVIATMDRRLVRKTLSKLSSADQRSLRAAIERMIG
jgi:mRNA interferase MazF